MLVDLGLDPYTIDKAIQFGFGMPMGPFRCAFRCLDRRCPVHYATWRVALILCVALGILVVQCVFWINKCNPHAYVHLVVRGWLLCVATHVSSLQRWGPVCLASQLCRTEL